ncbi:MAG: diguanylate cyclase [Desulfobacterales bacterium]|nr:diguanylate cyclase [Desulfobacterales bacterium]
MSIKRKLWLAITLLIGVTIIGSIASLWITTSQYREMIHNSLSSNIRQLNIELEQLSEKLKETLILEVEEQDIISVTRSLYLIEDNASELKRNIQCDTIKKFQELIRNKNYDLIAFYDALGIRCYANQTDIYIVTFDQEKKQSLHFVPTAGSVLVQCESKQWRAANPLPNVEDRIILPENIEIYFVNYGKELFAEGIISIKTTTYTETGEEKIIPSGAILLRQKLTDNYIQYLAEKMSSNMALFLSSGELSVKSSMSKDSSTKCNLTENNKHMKTMINNALIKGEFFGDVNLENEKYYILLKPYIFNQKNVCIAASYASTELERENIKKSFVLQFGGVVASLLFAALIAVLMENFIIRPIILITKQMNKISSEKRFDQKVTVKSKDEIGMLANSFNQMLDMLERRNEEAAQYVKELADSNAQLEKYKVELENLVKERTVELVESNAKLSDSIKELKERNIEMLKLGQMSDLLHACRNENDIHTVVISAIKKLFPDDSGYLCILDNSRTKLEIIATWGNNITEETNIDFEDCWALRRGKIHFLDSQGIGIVCSHLNASHRDFYQGYMCVPIAAQGDMLGVIHLSFCNTENVTIKDEDKIKIKSKQSIIMRIIEHYSLSLVNLRLRESLKLESTQDPLTGLYNRRYMQKSLEREISRCKRHKSSLCVIMLDIDHFKKFNDTYGHEAGDVVLKGLGNLLKSRMRQEDIICRYGGEEFVIILPDMELEDSKKRAEELRQEIKSSLKIEYKEVILKITVSMGISTYPNNGVTINEVLKSADLALYQAKNQGRDRIVTSNN